MSIGVYLSSEQLQCVTLSLVHVLCCPKTDPCIFLPPTKQSFKNIYAFVPAVLDSEVLPKYEVIYFELIMHVTFEILIDYKCL